MKVICTKGTQIVSLVLFFSSALVFLFTQSACDDDGGVYSLPDYPTKTMPMWIEGERTQTGIGPACPGEDISVYGPRETLYIIYKDGGQFRRTIYGYYGSGPVDILVPVDGSYQMYVRVEGSCNECCRQYGPPDKYKPVWAPGRAVPYQVNSLIIDLEFQECTYCCYPP